MFIDTHTHTHTHTRIHSFIQTYTHTHADHYHLFFSPPSEDDEWEKTHVHSPPASLKDFLFRLESRKQVQASACGGRYCPHPLSEWRTSCASCGDKCCVTCSMRMLKKTLGVTNPHTMNDAVVCCMECFARLCKSMAATDSYGVGCCKGKGHSI